MKTVEEYRNSHFFECIDKLENDNSEQYDVSIELFCENKTSLSELYQNCLNKSSKYDYVIFMHDDLEIHDQFFFEKLIKAHEQYDIVGLAGATSQDYSTIIMPSGQELPLVWHLRKTKPEHGRGIVSHTIPKGFNGCEFSHINSAYFGPTPCRVAVIDGLFMSFKMESLKEKDEVFDRDFTFHHYDMGMAVRANIMSLTMGVYPIFCIHHGLGEYANDKTWHLMAEKFKQKYSNYKTEV
jgi:GT2 family glycosyltransferase